MSNLGIQQGQKLEHIKEPEVINANKIFKDVTGSRVSSARASVASRSIEQLKDNRNIFEKALGGYSIEEGTLSEHREIVTDAFQEYTDAGIKMPGEIIKRLRIVGSNLKEPNFLNEQEVKELKNLVNLAEQKLQFDQELGKNPVLGIEGNLKDIFEGKVPSEKELLGYTDSLKKWLTREKCVPELVLSDRDPRKFIFIFQGEKDNAPEWVEVNVKTLADLDQLQINLEKCGVEAKTKRSETEKQTKISIIQGKDPFGIKEGLVKKTVLEEFNQLSEDKRNGWDKFVGFFGRETKHVKQLKIDNQLAFTQLKIKFNIIVKGQSLKDVVNTLPKDLRDKLNSGERLTNNEVKQLQARAFRAMQEERFEEDLRKKVPREIKGNLKAAFAGQTLDKPVFERYLSKLKESLIRGGYPGFVTSDVDPRKFLFFQEGQLKIVTVDSVDDLDSLEMALKACREKAVKWDSEKVIESLKSKYEQKIEALQKENEQVVKWTNEKVIDSMKSEHGQEIGTLKKESETLVGMLDQNLVIANNKVKEQEEIINKLMAELDKQTAILKKGNIEMAEVERKNVAQQQEIDKGKQAYEKLKNDYEKQMQLLGETKAEHMRVKEELTELQNLAGNVEYLKSVVENSKKELEVNARKNDEMSVLLLDQAKNLQEMEKKEDELVEQAEANIVQLMFAGFKIGAGFEDREEIGGEVEQLRNEKETLQKEIREMEAQKARLREEIEDKNARRIRK